MKSESPNGKNSKSTGGSSFATKGNDDSQRTTIKCPSCGSNHWLSQCEDFKNRSIEERFKLVRSLKLCDNCLVPGHVARSCNKRSFCKIEGCKYKHSTFLHRRPVNPDDDRKTENPENKNANPQHPTQVGEQNGRNGYVNVDDERRECRVIGLPIVPVKLGRREEIERSKRTPFLTADLIRHSLPIPC